MSFNFVSSTNFHSCRTSACVKLDLKLLRYVSLSSLLLIEVMRYTNSDLSLLCKGSLSFFLLYNLKCCNIASLSRHFCSASAYLLSRSFCDDLSIIAINAFNIFCGVVTTVKLEVIRVRTYICSNLNSSPVLRNCVLSLLDLSLVSLLISCNLSCLLV